MAAIISVIAIHTGPFAVGSSSMSTQFDLATVINQAARFAVPFFFTMSGYFWAQKFNDDPANHAPTIKMVRRIAFILFAWSIIYLLPTNIVDAFTHGALGPVKQIYWNVTNVVTHPLETVLQGTKTHLWFLMGLLSSLLISAVMLRYRQHRALAILAVALYAIGLAGKAYCDTPVGFHSEFNFRNGPFFSLIFFVTGYFLNLRTRGKNWLPLGLLIASAGLLLHFAELRMLQSTWGTTMKQDYVIGTYFFGLGAAMMALSGSRYLAFPQAASIGPYVLGIYASHLIFVDLLRPLDQHFAGSAIWALSYVVIVFLLSYALVRLMASYNVTRSLVM